MKKLYISLLSVLLIFHTSLYAHGGALDEHGCHHDYKNGGYHCHNGGSSSSNSHSGLRGGNIIGAILLVILTVSLFSQQSSSDNNSSLKHNISFGENDTIQTSLKYNF